MGYAAALPLQVQQQHVLFTLMIMNCGLPIAYFKYTKLKPRKKGVIHIFPIS